MKQFRKHLLVATLLASLGLAATAQTPPPPGGPPAAQRMEPHDPARMHQRMQEHRAKHLAELKETLKLNPAQESAWTAFTAATQLPATPRARPDRAEFEKLSTPERIDRMQAFKAERDEQMRRYADATKTFYAALTPEQKKTFDDQTLRHFGRGRHGQQGHHGMGPRH
ncbi:Spy/CpxP family protein refolding chaperone [Ramlibacter sp. 2FC]|uniref:Spy/CpxP family protein refolding chaperone n=1 Tax=Ramlibacter sp. 2FC TaxID=2502188 RepID=UPI0010F6C649|nr:Spy/CpxP family protein refolding chaperone [Ramlibacter sp. 2FC]